MGSNNPDFLLQKVLGISGTAQVEKGRLKLPNGSSSEIPSSACGSTSGNQT